MKCPSCGFENIKGTATCIRCSATLVWEGPRGREHFRPPRAESGLPLPGVRRRANQQGGAWAGLNPLRWRVWRSFAVLGRIPGRRWTVIATSIVPGLGQTRDNRILLGFFIFALWLAAILGGGWIRTDSDYDGLFSHPAMPFCLLMSACCLHFFAMIDAVKPVDFCVNRGELVAFLVSAGLFLCFCYLIVNRAFLGW